MEASHQILYFQDNTFYELFHHAKQKLHYRIITRKTIVLYPFIICVYYLHSLHPHPLASIVLFSLSYTAPTCTSVYIYMHIIGYWGTQ